MPLLQSFHPPSRRLPLLCRCKTEQSHLCAHDCHLGGVLVAPSLATIYHLCTRVLFLAAATAPMLLTGAPLHEHTISPTGRCTFQRVLCSSWRSLV